jgi:sortase A
LTNAEWIIRSGPGDVARRTIDHMSSAANDSVRRPRRPRVSVAGVAGELFLSVGALVLLFLGWQLWFNPAVSAIQQHGTADSLSNEWATEATATPEAEPTGNLNPTVEAEPKDRVTFANLIVPRFGADFKRPVSQGIGYSVLNSSALGLGHYPGTQMPGATGNFALASHRTAFGGAFHEIHTLRVGDPIFVETKDGWYKYTFRDLEYVRASGVGVILPVPQNPGGLAKDRIITLTTCNPFFSSAERIIAYGVFDRWYPRSEGPPREIADLAGKV